MSKRWIGVLMTSSLMTAAAALGPAACSDSGATAAGDCGAEFACGDGECIPKSWACDGMNDCAWGDDEEAQLCGAGPKAEDSVTPWSTPTTGGCGSVTYEGYCDGDTVIWCDDGSLEQVDCGAYGYGCGYSGGIYDCVAAEAVPPTSGGCGDVTYAGYCDGDVVIWCEGGDLQAADCGAYGYECGWNGSVYDCM